MDYKKKYEEAERLYRTANADQRYVLESLFPKLRESEDDRISKEIIKYLEQTVPHHHRDEVLKSKEWIAWLENIPYTIDHEKREGFHLGYKAGLEKQGETVWSEETDDDAWMNDIISKVENNLQLNKAEIDWLKSLKQRIGGKQ